jgi:chemotaxis family two-component system response regulator Rcp1
MNRSHSRPALVEVLPVEDSAGDVRLIREALKETQMHISLNVVSDGAEATAYLRREKHHTGAPRPELIILDLNLPKKDGRDVLREIKESDALKSIPVVVLTTSASPTDIDRSYQLHANCYITKPLDLRGFTKVVQSIDNFWLSVVQLPGTVVAS